MLLLLANEDNKWTLQILLGPPPVPLPAADPLRGHRPFPDTRALRDHSNPLEQSWWGRFRSSHRLHTHRGWGPSPGLYDQLWPRTSFFGALFLCQHILSPLPQPTLQVNASSVWECACVHNCSTIWVVRAPISCILTMHGLRPKCLRRISSLNHHNKPMSHELESLFCR